MSSRAATIADFIIIAAGLAGLACGISCRGVGFDHGPKIAASLQARIDRNGVEGTARVAAGGGNR